MNQPPITFSALTHRLLSWALTRLYDEAQRRGMTQQQAHAAILGYLIQQTSLEIAIDQALGVTNDD